jgi:ribonuclease VapC
MVIDTSAILAVLFKESERDAFAEAMAAAARRLVSAVSYVEAAVVVLARKGSAGVHDLELLVHRAGFDLVGFDRAQAALAREGYERFGKGRHRAGLNLGDCCAYALSRYSGEPLLFKGEDFAKTDVIAAAASAGAEPSSDA